MAVTPLQLVAAVGTVANEGEWIQPHLIKRIYDPVTGVTEKWTEPKKRRVISKEHARLVSSLLSDNILQGTQIAGQVPGYRVAGKTGTAQKVSASGRGYLAGQTIASFIGFLPADNPQLLILVVIDNPRTGGGWGNTVAGHRFQCNRRGGRSPPRHSSLPYRRRARGDQRAHEADQASSTPVGNICQRANSQETRQ